MNLKSLLFGLVIPLLLLVVGVGVYVGLKSPNPSTLPDLGDDRGALLSVMPAAEVAVVRALSELSETLDIQVNGSVVPYREISLAAEVAGRVIEKNTSVRSGDVVTKGQVLLKIDPRDYELEIERLTQRRDQELATLAELAQDVENAKRLLEVAEEDLLLAEGEVKRMRSLNRNVASQTELDRAQRSYLTARNQQITLLNQLESLEARGNRLRLAAKLAETELTQAQVNLERATVRSPVTGRIVSEQVEEDSFVQRGTPLMVIEDTEKVEVAVNLQMHQLYWILDENDLSTDQLINAAQASRYELPPVPVKVRFNLAGRERMTFEWDGILDRYDGAGLDPQSRTVPVRIVVDKPGVLRVNGVPSNESRLSGPSSLVRGMFVDVMLQPRPATPLFLVPKLAIKPATTSNQIWKFIPDERALDIVKEDNARPSAPKEDGAEATAAAPGTQSKAESKGDSTASRAVELDPSQWTPGFLQVIDGVHVVGAFNLPASPSNNAPPQPELTAAQQGTLATEAEYWICEIRGGSLAVGDQVIVSPLANVAGNGRDTVRVPVPQAAGLPQGFVAPTTVEGPRSMAATPASNPSS